ncbi:MAG: DUF4239 domain-containing protein [Verrucomicrobiales bacterium]|nr:DUF4239 domain-containing protein [Verrucomicrobiales bacterium]
MTLTLYSAVSAIGLFAGMVLLLELGRRLGRRSPAKDEAGARAGLAAVESAVLALMGLLVAFTFSGAATRFDTRRQLIVQEANAVGTAWLRIDLLPTSAQAEMRGLFRRYLDSRIAVYRRMHDEEATRSEIARAAALQGEIWTRATAACRESATPLPVQIVPAINDMFDIASTRNAATQIHPPTVVYGMLGVLALMSSLFAGYAMAGGRSRSWIHVLGFALILASTVYVILDLEFPRLGMVRIDGFDRVLVELRATMN